MRHVCSGYWPPGRCILRAGICPAFWRRGFAARGSSLCDRRTIPILNTSYNPASFSYWVAQIIRSFVVSRQSVTEEEAAEWFDEFAKLEENGAYFFCITPILTEAVKAA